MSTKIDLKEETRGIIVYSNVDVTLGSLAASCRLNVTGAKNTAKRPHIQDQQCYLYQLVQNILDT